MCLELPSVPWIRHGPRLDHLPGLIALPVALGEVLRIRAPTHRCGAEDLVVTGLADWGTVKRT